MLCQRARAASLALAFLFAAASPARVAARDTPGDRIAIDARDLDIYDVVRLLATQSDVNIVVDASVPHREITLRLQNVGFDEALATLAESNGLESVRVGDVTYLGMADVMNRRYPAHVSGVATRVFTLRAAVPNDVAKGLAGLLPLGTVIVPDARTSSVLVTAAPATLDRAREVVAALDAPSALQTLSIAMRYVRAATLIKTLQATLAIAAPATAVANDELNTVVLSGPPDFVAQAAALTGRLDRPGRQVRYDVRVTDVSPQNDSGNIGFLYGGATSGNGATAGATTVGAAMISFPVKTVAIDATLDALVTQGRAQILARPTISTMNDVAASLLVGEQYPIVYFDARTGTQQVQFVNIGVNLNVTPTIGSDDEIVTDLETDYSQVIGTAAGGYPRIGTRKAQSRLRVRDGETIVIAGLFSDFDSETVTKVPLLGDIPVLGEIFKNRQYARTKDEVVFLLTPHIVTDATQAESGLPVVK